MKTAETTLFIIIALASAFSARSQYDPKYVETKTLSINGETYAIEKLCRKDERIKVKYFAYREDGLSVYQRYATWSANKNIVAISSGTYMTTCDGAGTPVGLCVDNGNTVNENLRADMDGLLIVYATGGLVATNLKTGNLKIKINNKDTALDIRNNAYQRSYFMDWAKSQEATVFQSHLFVYQNQLEIATNSSSTLAPRRFLAVCKSGGNVFHYIINLPKASTLYDGAVKASNYLKDREYVDVVFMINLDPGCQDVYKVFDKAGNAINSPNFSGSVSITNAVNLLVYYYE